MALARELERVGNRTFRNRKLLNPQRDYALQNNIDNKLEKLFVVSSVSIRSDF